MPTASTYIYKPIVVFAFLQYFLSSAFCQNVYLGTVLNKTTNKGIPYASVSLSTSNKVTNADENGKFKIYGSSNVVDTLLITSVGYYSMKISTNDFVPNMQIELAIKADTLTDVVVSNKTGTSKWLNSYSNCGIHSFTTSGTTIMTAQFFQSDLKNGWLKEISLCKMTGKAMFRIRVFEMDSITRKPSKEITNSVIEVNTDKRHVSIPLEDYNIAIPGHNFFVAVEWLYIPQNENKTRMKINGKSFTQTQYAPFLFIKTDKNKNPSSNGIAAVWHFDNRGKWNRMPADIQIMMSAKIEY